MILPWNGFKLLKQNHGAGASVNNARGFVQLSMNLSLWRTSWSPWMQSWDRTASGEEQMPNTARAKSWKLLLRAYGISFASCLCDILLHRLFQSCRPCQLLPHFFRPVICISPALRNSSRPWSSWPWWNKRTWRSEMTDLPSFELYTAVVIALIPLASSQVDQEASASGPLLQFLLQISCQANTIEHADRHKCTVCQLYSFGKHPSTGASWAILAALAFLDIHVERCDQTTSLFVS